MSARRARTVTTISAQSDLTAQERGQVIPGERPSTLLRAGCARPGIQFEFCGGAEAKNLGPGLRRDHTMRHPGRARYRETRDPICVRPGSHESRERRRGIKYRINGFLPAFAGTKSRGNDDTILKCVIPSLRSERGPGSKLLPPECVRSKATCRYGLNAALPRTTRRSRMLQKERPPWHAASAFRRLPPSLRAVSSIRGASVRSDFP